MNNNNNKNNNIWTLFYETYGRSLSRRFDFNMWQPLIETAKRRADWIVPFFALARYEADRGDPLVCSECDPIVCVGTIASHLGFSYPALFSIHCDALQKDLMDRFNIDLLQTGRFHQYLRTIHRLSGAVYLKVARVAAAIPPEQWVADDKLDRRMADVVHRFSNGDEEDEVCLQQDVLDFFRGLQAAFRFCNEMPSFEFCRDHSPNLLSDQMLKNILRELSWTDNPTARGNRPSINSFLPSFRINGNGVVELGFSRAAFRVAAGHAGATTVVFEFRTRNGRRPVFVRFCNRDGAWKPEADSVLSFPPEDILSVLRREYDANAAPLSEQDVTPEVLTDPENSHLLLDSHGRPIDAKSSVMAGCSYRVVWLHGHKPVPVTAFDGEARALSIDSNPNNRSFVVPVHAASIRIYEVDRSVQTEANAWLNLEGQFRHVLREPGRLFFESGTYPFSDNFVESDQDARYRKSDGSEAVFANDASWRDPPEDILWDRGWIEFVSTETGELLSKRAVTFLPKIDATELEEPAALRDVPARHIRFGDGPSRESIPVFVPDATDSAEGRFVEVSTNHGFCFRYPVFRFGIMVSFPGTVIEPFVLSPERTVVLAHDDFVNAKFHFTGIQSASVRRGVTVYLDERKKSFTLHDLLDQYGLRKECGDDWSFFDNGRHAGSISVFRPEKTAWDDQSGHPAVCLERNGDELVVRFWMARRWKDNDLFLTWVPAHRQDDKANRKHLACARENRTFDNANGRLRAILRFPNFYSQSSIKDDFGAGLLSFVAIQDKNNSENLFPISAGFSIKRPDEWGEWALDCRTDPYGLRRAMAVGDLQTIEDAMMAKDPECRAWIRDFEKNTLDTLSSFGLSNLDFFHAYRSEISKENGEVEPSGYFFMAGWLLREKMLLVEMVGGTISQRMKPSYSGKWTPLLRAFARDEPDPDAAQWRSISANISSDRNTFDKENNFIVIWPFAGSFNDAGRVDRSIQNRLRQLIEDVASYWNSSDSEDRVDLSKADKTFDAGDPPGLTSTPIMGTRLSSVDLELCLSRLAKRVSEWRKNPSIKTAQRLRDLLVRVEEIDDDLRNKLSLSNFGDRLPARTMTQRIAMKSWLFD